MFVAFSHHLSCLPFLGEGYRANVRPPMAYASSTICDAHELPLRENMEFMEGKAQ
jgi:hypothetical protein